MQHYPTINESNYQNIEILIRNELENIQKLEQTLLPEQEQLKTTGDLLAMTEKVIGGTYVQSLVREERERIFKRTPDSAAEFLTHLNALFTMNMCPPKN